MRVYFYTPRFVTGLRHGVFMAGSSIAGLWHESGPRNVESIKQSCNKVS